MSESEAKALAEYRKAIRLAWLAAIPPRKKLKTAEYQHITRWHKEGIPARLVLRAIIRCVERARRNGRTLWTIGVIQADINALMKIAAATQVGSGSTNQKPGTESWRVKWIEDLQAMHDELVDYGDPERAAMVSELLDRLPSFPDEAAAKREFQETMERGSTPLNKDEADFWNQHQHRER